MRCTSPRSRHLQYQDEDGDWRGDPTADLGRITRQQVFIRRALSAAVDTGLGNPVKLNGVLSALVPKLGVDENLDAGDILALARRFEDFDAENLETFSLPTSSERSPAGASVEMLREDEAEPMLNIFRGLPPGAISPSSVEVQVLNGTGVAGQAADVSEALTEIGFEVGEPASLEERYTRTTVRFGEGAEARARLVARHITGGAALVPDAELDEGEVVLVTGADLTTLHTQPSPEGAADDLRSTTSTTTAATSDDGDGELAARARPRRPRRWSATRPESRRTASTVSGARCD